MKRLALLPLLTLLWTAPAPAVPPPLPQPATSFGAAISADWLYVYGGNLGKAHEFHRDCIRGEFFRAKLPDGEAWEALPGDQPLLGAAMVEYGGCLYRVGGMTALNAKGEPNNLHSSTLAARYSVAAGQWEPLPPLPEGRSSHDVAVLGHTLYVAGGWNLDGDRRETENWHTTLLTLDLQTPERGWQTLPQPFQRRAAAAVPYGGRLWLLGGMTQDNQLSRAVEWFDPVTGAWGHGPELPQGAMEGFGIAACVGGGRLLTSPFSGIVWSLSGDGQKWEECARLAQPRFFHRLLPLDATRAIAVGGSNRESQIRDSEIIDLHPVAALPVP